MHWTRMSPPHTATRGQVRQVTIEEKLLLSEIPGAFSGNEAMRERLAGRLLKLLRPMILHVLRRRGDTAQESEDILQGILVELLRREGHILKKIDPARGSPRTFLYKVLTRWMYRQRPRQPTQALDERASVHEYDFAEEVDRMLCVERVVAMLDSGFSERDGRLFRRIFVEGGEIKQVAADEQMSVDAVHQWCTRTRQRAEAIARKAGCHHESV